MLHLGSRLAELPRVGPATAKLLSKLGLDSIQDLLFYFPLRYDDFAQTREIASLKPGENASLSGTIELIQNKKSFRRRLYVTEALISDESESIKAIWFNQPFLTRNLKVGDRVSLAGKITETYGQLSLVSPAYEKIGRSGPIHTKGLVPRYHLTSGLTQKQLRFFIKQCLPLAKNLEEWLPEGLRRKLSLVSLSLAIKQVHFPSSEAEALSARRRLSFGELFLRQLKSQTIKAALKEKRAPVLAFREKETKEFVAKLPFALTGDQRRAAWEILQDMAKASPMSRLLEGDVGSGKTLVAALAILSATLNNSQSLLMAPTEILAQQHHRYLEDIFKDYGFKIGRLTASAKLKEAETYDIIVGTHALIQPRHQWPRLALAIVDEQHRFGVGQRQNIISRPELKGLVPHFLSMTATPIPRSLALAIYGDLDLSLIQEMPAGRKPIITDVVLDSRRQAAYDFVKKEIQAGRQAFVICPLIEDSDRLEAKSAKAEQARLQKEIFPEFKVGLLHGRQSAKEKEGAMHDFLEKKTQILVSTSVVEVGVDIKNASLMLIEGAERFGLAQLHQFRGRVGRGEHQSYCLLFPSQEESSGPALSRLLAMKKYHDGFSLAKLDLKLRGAGELYGTSQSGFPELQLASLFDYALIKQAKDEAAAIVSADPKLEKHPAIKSKLGEWEDRVHLE